MEKSRKNGKKHQKIRKKCEIVLKSVFFVVLGDFLGVLGCFEVFFRVFRGFLQKKVVWDSKNGRTDPPRGGGGGGRGGSLHVKSLDKCDFSDFDPQNRRSPRKLYQTT